MAKPDQPVIGVIDYRTGNSQSVAYALDHQGVPNRLLTSPRELPGIDRIILPGVGAAGTTMDYLRAAGWPDALRERVLDGGMPFLGVCVGLQVLFEHSEEQDADCLGWLPGTVRAFDRAQVRVPQMGWNQLKRTSDHPFLAEFPDGGHVYFVNSYYAVPGQDSDAAGVTEYGVEFTSAVARGNIMATQFHTEKSARAGLQVLKAFCDLEVPVAG